MKGIVIVNTTASITMVMTMTLKVHGPFFENGVLCFAWRIITEFFSNFSYSEILSLPVHKSFRSFHSFWKEDDLSRELNTFFTEWHHYHIMIIQFQGHLTNSGSVQLYRNRLVLLYERKISRFSFCNPHFSFGNYHLLVFIICGLG